MASLIAKAAEERSKWIVDKYHYGVNCNTCKYEWKKYAILDFVSLCFDVCTENVEVTSPDYTLDCSGNAPVYINIASSCTGVAAEKVG